MLGKYSVKKPYTVVVGVILVIVLGVISFTNMTTDLLPNMDFPYVIVYTTYVGATPEQVENEVTRPMESAFATLTDIDQINSTSSDNLSLVILQFNDTADMNTALIEINSEISALSATWSDSIGAPAIMKINPNMLPVSILSVARDDMDLIELSDYVEQTLIPAFESVNGVASVTASGAITQEVDVTIEQDRIDVLNNAILRDVDAQLADVEQQLDDAQAQLNDGRSQLARMRSSTLAQLDDALEQLEGGEEQLGTAIETLTAQRGELQTQLDEVNAAVSQLEMLTNLTDEQRALLVELETQLANLRAQRDALEDQLDAIESGEGDPTLQAQRDEAQARRDELAAERARYEAYIDDLTEGDAGALAAEIAEIDAQLAGMDEAIAETQRELSAKTDARDATQAHIDELREEIAALGGATATPSLAPTTTPATGATDAPETTPTSGATNTPETTPTSGATDAPETTPTSGATDAPETTPTSGATNTPETTPTSGATDAPETTPTSGATDAPETTPTSGATDAPETTPTSGATDAPETTPTSGATDAPETTATDALETTETAGASATYGVTTTATDDASATNGVTDSASATYGVTATVTDGASATYGATATATDDASVTYGATAIATDGASATNGATAGADDSAALWLRNALPVPGVSIDPDSGAISVTNPETGEITVIPSYTDMIAAAATTSAFGASDAAPAADEGAAATTSGENAASAAATESTAGSAVSASGESAASAAATESDESARATASGGGAAAEAAPMELELGLFRPASAEGASLEQLRAELALAEAQLSELDAAIAETQARAAQLDADRAGLAAQREDKQQALDAITGGGDVTSRIEAAQREIAALDIRIAAVDAEIKWLDGMLSGDPDRIQAIRDGIAKFDEAIEVIVNSDAYKALQLATDEDELNAQYAAAVQGQAQLEAGIEQVDGMLEKLNQGVIPGGIVPGLDEDTDLASAREQIEAGRSQALSAFADAEAQLDAAAAQLAEGRAEFEEQRDEALENAGIDGIITLETVAGLVGAQNMSMPAGYVYDLADDEYLVRVGDEFASIDEMRQVKLFSLGLDSVDDVRLSDVASVEIADDSAESFTKVDGQDGILLSIEKQSTFSTTDVAERVLARSDELTGADPALHLVEMFDQGEYINVIIDSVIENLLWGAGLAILVLLVFLLDWRPTVIIAFSIPLSVVIAFVCMYFTGITLNVLSLSGLALGIGMLVDNSIVSIDNIYRLHDEEKLPILRSCVQGVNTISGALTSSTLTTISVFLPVVFVTGLAHDLFTDIGLTITYSLVASLLVAMTLVPSMAAALLKRSRKPVKNHFGAFQKFYVRTLRGALRFKPLVLLLAVALLAVTVLQVPKMSMSFMPEVNSTQMTASLALDPEGDLDAQRDQAVELMERIMAIDGVATVGLTGGTGALAMMSGGGGDLTYYIIVDSAAGRANVDIGRDISAQAEEMGMELGVQTSTMDISMLTGTGVSVDIIGDDVATLRQIAGEVAQIIAGVEGTAEIDDGLEASVPEISITVDKERATDYNLTVGQVLQFVATKLAGKTEITEAELNGKNMAVYVLDGRNADITPDTLADLEIEAQTTDGSELVRLGDIAQIERTQSLSSINRRSQQRLLSVTFDAADGYALSHVSDAVEAALAEYQPPEGYTVSLSGENETVNEIMGDMVFMMAVALVLIFLIMVAQFQSFKSPFIVLFTIPLAFTGGLIALLLTGMDLSIVAMVGFLVLMGVVVNNGIVFVDSVNQMRIAGMTKREALLETGRVRLRPILMTAITTILGMLTLALGVGMGSEMMQPMAVVTIGGLTYATFMTLFIVPVLYDMFNGEKMSAREIQMAREAAGLNDPDQLDEPDPDDPGDKPRGKRRKRGKSDGDAPQAPDGVPQSPAGGPGGGNAPGGNAPNASAPNEGAPRGNNPKAGAPDGNGDTPGRAGGNANHSVPTGANACRNDAAASSDGASAARCASAASTTAAANGMENGAAGATGVANGTESGVASATAAANGMENGAAGATGAANGTENGAVSATGAANGTENDAAGATGELANPDSGAEYSPRRRRRNRRDAHRAERDDAAQSGALAQPAEVQPGAGDQPGAANANGAQPNMANANGAQPGAADMDAVNVRAPHAGKHVWTADSAPTRAGRSAQAPETPASGLQDARDNAVPQGMPGTIGGMQAQTSAMPQPQVSGMRAQSDAMPQPQVSGLQAQTSAMPQPQANGLQPQTNVVPQPQVSGMQVQSDAMPQPQANGLQAQTSAMPQPQVSGLQAQTSAMPQPQASGMQANFYGQPGGPVGGAFAYPGTPAGMPYPPQGYYAYPPQNYYGYPPQGYYAYPQGYSYPPQNYAVPQPGNIPQGYGNAQPGNIPQGYGNAQPGNIPQGYGNAQPGNIPQGYGNAQPGNLPQGYGNAQPGNLPQGYGNAQPGSVPQGYGNAQPGGVPQSNIPQGGVRADGGERA